MKHLSAALIPALLFPAIAQAQSVFDLDEIVFSAGLTEQEAARVGVSVDVVTAEDLGKTGDLQLTDFLSRLPGVTVSQNGPFGTPTNLRVRGAGDAFIPVYIDGILVNDPTATSGDFPGFGTLMSTNIARVELLRGSQSAVYGGNAVAGVLSITTTSPVRDRAEGTSQTFALEAGSNQTLQTAYALSQRSGAMTLDLGVTHYRSDGFSSADENDGNTEADGATSTRLSFGASYAVSDRLTVGVNGFTERGEGDFDEQGSNGPEDGTPGDDHGSNDLFGFRGYAMLETDQWDHNLSFSYLETDRRQVSTTPFAFSTFSSRFQGERRTASYTASTDLIEHALLSFGLDWREDQAAYANLPTGSASVESVGAFAEAVVSPTALLDITTSLRFEDNSSFGPKTTGRVAFAYRASERLTLRGAIANGYRPPSIDELYGNYPASGPFIGNPNLSPEESQSAELGFEYRFANDATLSGTVYRLDIKDLITFQSCGAFPCPGATFSTLVNTPGTSRFNGFEVAGTLPVSARATIAASYGYNDAREANGKRLTEVPRHDLNILFETMLADDWTAAVAMQVAADTLDATPSGSLVQIDDYAVFDATLTHALSDRVDAYVRIENLLDREYQTALGYGTSDRAFYLGLRSRF
ncbi:TonB-dependent receptor plug domain-containing protein [Roseicyclus sp.]|uniref:TonB-dependent receptor plug domain-containing protein n=1 Tax=Roseicyclus sp. TaxID=1914329 RepID=UPI003F6A029B